MKFRHDIVYILCIIVLLAFLMFLPFLPGRYDALAEPVSFVIQVFSITGTALLFPFGWIWLIYESRTKTGSKTKGFVYAFCVLAFLVGLSLLAGGNAKNHLLLGVLLFVAVIFSCWRLQKASKRNDPSFLKRIPLYLILIPSALLLIRMAGISKAVNYSMSLAIKNAAVIIGKIETYKKNFGSYPVSLLSEWNDFPPGVIGVQRFWYEPNGNSYNLFFEQFPDELDLKQFVMYNPEDNHHFTCHDTDLLEYTGTELDLRRGDRHRHELKEPHWIYFDLD